MLSSPIRACRGSTKSVKPALTPRRHVARLTSRQPLLFVPNINTSRPASTLGPLPSKSRVSTIFGALIILGVGSTAFGLYEFYRTFTMWPPEVRGDLRAGIKAKNQGDLNLSERFLHRALDTALALPLETLSDDPHLKLSGIAIALAGVLEENGKPQAAYDVYASALQRLRAANGLSGRERLRTVGVAYKLGEMAEIYQQSTKEEERWLVYAVEEMLRILRDEQLGSVPSSSATGERTEVEQQWILSDLELPSWVDKTDVVSPLQALGAFYNRTGRQEYAVPLYLSALSVLMPTGSKRTTPEHKCQGADLMNSLADTLLIGSPTPERREQAEAWLNKALDIIEDAKTSSKGDAKAIGHCELVLAAALFNLGSLREMAGDLGKAREAFIQSRQQSSFIKLREGVLEADIAIRRLDRISKTNQPSGSIPTSVQSK